MAEAAGDLGILVSVPLFHVTGSHPIFMLSLILGRKMVLMRSWKPEEAVRLPGMATPKDGRMVPSAGPGFGVEIT